MTIELKELRQKSDVVPLLVQLYDSQKSKTFSKVKSKKAQTELTTLVTSLLNMDLSSREAELVADVLISLMRQVEKTLCIELSERLSVMETVPLRLALHIANDTIDVAGPMLRHSKVFNEQDLVYIIKSKPAEYWRVIAQREELGIETINILSNTKDLETAIKLAENENITLSDHALNTLVNYAKISDELAEPLLRRDEITEDMVKTLYQSVGIALKEYIRQNFDIRNNDILEAADEVIIEFVEAADTKSLFDEDGGLPTEAHLKVAERYQERGVLSLQVILQTLKAGRYKSFVAQFSTYLGLSAEILSQILLQETGQGLAIICKANSIKRNEFISIYLLASRLRNKGGMMNAKNLNRATQYFDRVDYDMARDLFESSKKYNTSMVKN